MSIAIFSPIIDGIAQGIQITSSNISFLRKGDKGFIKAQKVYRWKGKDVLLKIIPQKIELLDYSLLKMGYGKNHILEL